MVETTDRGLVHHLDAGRYRAVIREGIPMIERADTASAVHYVTVPISRELLAELAAIWSQPVQFKIENGELTFRAVPH